MSKRPRKQKAHAQKPKWRKRPAGTGGGEGASAGASGSMTGMRSWFRGVAGRNKDNKQKGVAAKVIDWALWGAVIVAGYYFVSNRC